jgi:hypothetical protein
MHSVALLRQGAVSFSLLAALSCGTESTAVENPVPGITTLVPAEATSGSSGLTLTVDGSDFVAGSVVNWNGTPRPTTFVSRTRLTVSVDAANLLVAGQIQVTVANPTPGGGLSNVAVFTVRQAQNPSPTLTSIAPTEATIGGSGDVTVTLTGTNFLPTSSVRFSIATPGASIVPPVTFVSAMQLTVTLTSAQLQNAGVFQVTVSNPFPGGGVSSPSTFTVKTPVPAITALSHSSATAGKEADTLFVDGTGFYSGSTVRFNGGIRATTLVSSTRLRSILVAGDLATPGSYEITVVNPAPGGGTSAATAFAIVAGTPTIVGLPAQGGSAGRPGFSLAVDGTNFIDGAVVQWNGSDRPTTFRSGIRLLASISADDVAAAGTAQITVRNPGVTTVSNAVTFTVRVVAPAQITSQLAVSLKANDVIWDATRSLLYASVPSDGGTYGNSIAAIDPTTGAIMKSVFVGSEPEHMAISDDGQYLYVSLRGASSVRRVTLSTFTASLEFAVGGGLVVEEMLVIPGAPRSVVLSKMNTGSSPRHVGVFVYDDGAQRGSATPGHTGSNSIAFAGRSASILYGYNNETTDFGFRTMVIDGAGIREVNSTGGLIGVFYARIFGAGGRVYSTQGAIIDPELRVRTGSFTGLPGGAGGTVTLHPDPQLGRVYFLASGSIAAHDMNTMQSLGAINPPGSITDHPYAARVRLVRWGTDGFAYRDATQVHILRSTLAAP